MFGHHRQAPGANRLPHTEDTEGSIEIVNNTESTCITGEAYTIEQRVNDVWTILPIKPRKDGAVYAFNDIGYELVRIVSDKENGKA